MNCKGTSVKSNCPGDKNFQCCIPAVTPKTTTTKKTITSIVTNITSSESVIPSDETIPSDNAVPTDVTTLSEETNPSENTTPSENISPSEESNVPESTVTPSQDSMKITRLKLNGVVNPFGFDFKKLIASWNVEDTKASTLKNGLLEVASDENFKDIIYKKDSADLDQVGEVIDIKLTPRTRYFWRVTITGDNGETATSDTQFFETGKMDEPWTGKWIAAEKGADYHPIFSKTLQLKKEPVKARLYVSCLGVFEAHLDGVKIGDEILTPYINDYVTGMQIIAFDVIDKLKVDSTLDIQVAKGWYMSKFAIDGGYDFGDQMKAIAELHVSYEDGTEEVIGTDASWKVLKSDVTESGIYYGEDLDRTAGTPEMGAAVEVENEHVLLDRYSLPVKVMEILPAKEIITTPKGETVIDFGQNHAGIMEFDVIDFPEGTVITVDCGEVLQEDNFYNENYRTARSRFVYTSDGRSETIHPKIYFLWLSLH